MAKNKNTFDELEKDASAWSRAIVARRTGITALVAGLIAIGVIPNVASGWLDTAFQVVVLVAGLGAGVVAAQQKTTPADPMLNPISINGFPLLENRNTGAHPSASTALEDFVEPDISEVSSTESNVSVDVNDEASVLNDFVPPGGEVAS